jgi:5-methylcytosine-specific restriction endonuclease McrA
MPTIQSFINDRNKYKVDHTYQRPVDAWSKADKQCLIDTILRGEPMPLFFMNFDSDEEKFYIVDGQQRLHCIQEFYENKLILNKSFSGEENHKLTFNGEKGINDKQKKDFLDYNLQFHIMEDYDDERVRLIFSRLQRGKPLQLGERLNAKAGSIVKCMREVANHNFMKFSVGVSQNRYGVYPDAGRILFYEMYGSKQMGSNELYGFFDRHKDLNLKSKEFKNVITNLNFLEKCFPKEPGNYKYLEKHAWVLAVYTMIRDLKVGYSLFGQEENIRKFVKSFHSKVYNEAFRTSKPNYQRFYDNVRGGWSEKIITIRKQILIDEFLLKNNLSELDDRRQINDEEKISAFGKANGICEYPNCGLEFKDYKEAEYHHKEMYSKGGKTELKNIMVLCTKCHDLIHGKDNSELVTEDEYEEIE